MSQENHEYKKLTEDDINSYLGSKDATENEKNAVKQTFDEGVSLFKVKRYNRQFILSKKEAIDYLNNDLALEKTRYYFFYGVTILFFIIISTINIMTFIEENGSLFWGLLSFLVILPVIFMVWDYNKNLKNLKAIKNYIKTTDDSINTELSMVVEIRKFSDQ